MLAQLPLRLLAIRGWPEEIHEESRLGNRRAGPRTKLGLPNPSQEMGLTCGDAETAAAWQLGQISFARPMLSDRKILCANWPGLLGLLA
jgi:hypothetical protein